LAPVHYVGPQGKTHLVADGLAFPNGIVLRPDGKALLVGESQQNRILAYEVTAPGKVARAAWCWQRFRTSRGIRSRTSRMAWPSTKRGTFTSRINGMHTVQVVSPEGKLLRSYPGGNLTTSNVAFAGPAAGFASTSRAR
jgi:gluconolactonase